MTGSRLGGRLPTLAVFHVTISALLAIALVSSAAYPLAVVADSNGPDGAAANFELKQLAEGVYGVIRKDPPGFMVDANDLFIINEDDVVVVDTNGAPSTTRLVLTALRKLTSKPVSYVINTHGHDDHIRGNVVYKEAFPGVQFIAHEKTREALLTVGESNRKSFLEGAPKFCSTLEDLVKTGKSLGGGELTAEERIAYESDVRLARLAINEAPGAPAIIPTVTVSDRLTLYRGNRTIEIQYLGRGHTSGDLVVYLPQESIVATGDLVVWPVPFTGSDQSHIGDWARTLERICALNPKTIVPGHGPVLSDCSYLKTMAGLFASIQQQADAAESRGETLEQARKSIKLDDFKQKIAGDSTLRKLLFANYVAYPAVAAAYQDARQKK